MELTFDEETILILYAEFYRKLYKPLEKEGVYIKHEDVQSLIYIIQQLVQSHQDFSFSWNGNGPYSPRLEALLINLDKKEKLCTLFYRNYLNNCLFKNKNKMIENYYPNICIEKIEQAIIVLNEIIEEYGADGCELIASLLYIATSILPGCRFDIVSEELKYRTNKFKDEVLIKKAWHCLEILSLINKNNTIIKSISSENIEKDIGNSSLCLKLN